MIARKLMLPLLTVLLAFGKAEAQKAQLSIDGRLVRNGTDTFAASYSGALLGHGITHRSRVGNGDRIQILQVYTWRDTRGSWIIDSLFADERSLLAVRQVRVVPDTVVETRYTPQGVEVMTRLGDGSGQRKSFVAGPVAISSAALEAVVAASPLSPGFEQEYQLFYAPPSPRGLVQIRLRVTGAERVKDRSGADREAWVVSASTPGGGTVFWIDKATRSVLRFDTREGPATIEFRR